jgi:hypothetical protein
MMRFARRSLWARAKHRAGLERPHFLGFQPPKKPLGSLQPSVFSEAVQERRLPAFGAFEN